MSATQHSRGLSVHLSVCPSHDGTVSKRRKLGSQLPTDTGKSLLQGFNGSVRNSKWLAQSDGVKWEWGRESADFRPVSRRISETENVVIDH